MSPRIRNAFLYFAASLLACIALICSSAPAFAQTTESSGEQAQEAQWTSGTSPSSDQARENQEQPSTQSVICGVKHLGQCLKDIGHDQAGIWTSPLRIAPRDAIWLVPFAAGTGVALHYDAQAQQNLGIDKSRIDASNIVSGFGSPYATLGGAAGLYFLGLGTHNEHLAETGRLGAEAVIDSVLVVAALKLATNRERPNEGNGQGGFWPHGTRSYELDGSFPSGHATESFALARVIASEYPSKPVQGPSGCLRVCRGNQREPCDRAPALSFRRSRGRHSWVSDRWVRGPTSLSGKRCFGIFLCSRSGCVHPYFWRQRRTTSRSDRFGEGWSAHEPDASEIEGEPVKISDRIDGGLVTVGTSRLFSPW